MTLPLSYKRVRLFFSAEYLRAYCIFRLFGVMFIFLSRKRIVVEGSSAFLITRPFSKLVPPSVRLSIGRSLTFSNCECFFDNCSCPNVRDLFAGYPALFQFTFPRVMRVFSKICPLAFCQSVLYFQRWNHFRRLCSPLP